MIIRSLTGVTPIVDDFGTSHTSGWGVVTAISVETAQQVEDPTNYPRIKCVFSGYTSQTAYTSGKKPLYTKSFLITAQEIVSTAGGIQASNIIYIVEQNLDNNLPNGMWE